MKIKATVNCTGSGYENLKAEEEREVSAEVGKLLASYGYAEILEQEEKDLIREELIKQFNDFGLVGNAEELTTDCIKDCVETHIAVLEREKLTTEEKARLGADKEQTTKDKILKEEKTGIETKSYEEVKETAKNLGISVFGVSKENLIQKITEINK